MVSLPQELPLSEVSQPVPLPQEPCRILEGVNQLARTRIEKWTDKTHQQTDGQTNVSDDTSWTGAGGAATSTTAAVGDELPLPVVSQTDDLPQELEESGVCVHMCVWRISS